VQEVKGEAWNRKLSLHMQQFRAYQARLSHMQIGGTAARAAMALGSGSGSSANGARIAGGARAAPTHASSSSTLQSTSTCRGRVLTA